MNRKICGLVAGLLAIFFAGCQSEMPAVDEAGDESVSKVPMIKIMGGKPSGLALTSRAEPAKPGVCNADRLQLWVYRGLSTLATVNPTIDKYSLSDPVDVLEGLRYQGSDKVTSFSLKVSRDGGVRAGYIVPALAYSQEERGNFTISKESEVTNITLSLTADNLAPEIYFGRLLMESTETGNNSFIHTTDGLMSVLRSHASDISNQKEPEAHLYGRLYRIVSRLNVKISDIDINSIGSLELMVSNVPTSVKLYGNHGVYYNLTVAGEGDHKLGEKRNPSDANSELEYISIAKTDSFREEKVVLKNEEGKEVESRTFVGELGAFMLPSQLGRKIRIRVNFKELGDGTTPQSKEYDIRPSKDFFLTGDDAKVYSSGVKKHNDDVYVYDHVNDEFYSISNVMVNIFGKYDKVFSETETVDVQIEVCPSFEAAHEFVFGGDGNYESND